MLNSITRVLLQPNKKEITTYKIIQRFNNNILFNLSSTTPKRSFFKFSPIGEWTSCYIDNDGYKWANINLKSSDSGEEYPTGFHCFLNFDDVKKVMEYYKGSKTHIICKCQSKYRMVFGLQKYYVFNEVVWAKIVVCRGIKITEIL